MQTSEIIALLKAQFLEAITDSNTEVPQPWVQVAPDALVAIAAFLKNDDRLYFDLLESVSGVDNGAKANTMGVVYHFVSIPYHHVLTLKCFVARASASEDEAEQAPEYTPTLPSLAPLYKTADWHEREIFDLYGIRFTDHPDMRRIFMPEDWPGHPLRKDYETPETYRGIEVDY